MKIKEMNFVFKFKKLINMLVDLSLYTHELQYLHET